MHFVPQIIFIAILVTAIWLFTKNILQIRSNIFLGMPEQLTDNKPQRFRNLLLLALGQKKMFKNKVKGIISFLF